MNVALQQRWTKELLEIGYSARKIRLAINRLIMHIGKYGEFAPWNPTLKKDTRNLTYETKLELIDATNYMLMDMVKCPHRESRNKKVLEKLHEALELLEQDV